MSVPVAVLETEEVGPQRPLVLWWIAGLWGVAGVLCAAIVGHYFYLEYVSPSSMPGTVPTSTMNTTGSYGTVGGVSYSTLGIQLRMGVRGPGVLQDLATMVALALGVVLAWASVLLLRGRLGVVGLWTVAGISFGVNLYCWLVAWAVVFLGAGWIWGGVYFLVGLVCFGTPALLGVVFRKSYYAWRPESVVGVVVERVPRVVAVALMVYGGVMILVALMTLARWLSWDRYGSTWMLFASVLQNWEVSMEPFVAALRFLYEWMPRGKMTTGTWIRPQLVAITFGVVALILGWQAWRGRTSAGRIRSYVAWVALGVTAYMLIFLCAAWSHAFAVPWTLFPGWYLLLGLIVLTSRWRRVFSSESEKAGPSSGQ